MYLYVCQSQFNLVIDLMFDSKPTMIFVGFFVFIGNVFDSNTNRRQISNDGREKRKSTKKYNEFNIVFDIQRNELIFFLNLILIFQHAIHGCLFFQSLL